MERRVGSSSRCATSGQAADIVHHRSTNVSPSRPTASAVLGGENPPSTARRAEIMSASTNAYAAHARQPRTNTAFALIGEAPPPVLHPHTDTAASAGTVAADSFAPSAMAS